MSWVKKEIGYIKDSFSQIINGIILFLLATSGLGCAIGLRFLGFSGTIISFVSILVEIFALVIAYFYLRRFFAVKEEQEQKPRKIK